MKLDVSVLKFLERDDFRVLTAVEMGMKNHDLVPTELICKIASLPRGGGFRSIKILHKHKLIYHEAKICNHSPPVEVELTLVDDGYRLTYAGYDYLALRAMNARESITAVGNQIGVGKESDVFTATNEGGDLLVLKLHRLGRVSFRTIKLNRDYLRHRRDASWLYMSRLAAMKEFAFMKVLHASGFPVPKPIDLSRHCVLMEHAKGYPMQQVRELAHPHKVYEALMNIIVRFARYGLIHCDYNEFNILIDDDEKVTIIDFPQMMSMSHPNAQMYFERDVECIKVLFEKKYGVEYEWFPTFEDARPKDASTVPDIMKSAAQHGFTPELNKEFEKFAESHLEAYGGGVNDEESDEEDTDETQSEGEEDSVDEDHLEQEASEASSCQDNLDDSFRRLEVTDEDKQLNQATEESEPRDLGEKEENEEDEEEEEVESSPTQQESKDIDRALKGGQPKRKKVKGKNALTSQAIRNRVRRQRAKDNERRRLRRNNPKAKQKLNKDVSGWS